MARAIKQEPVLGDCPSDLYQHNSTPDMSPPTTLDLNNGTITFDQMPADSGDPGLYGNSRTCQMKELVRDNILAPISPSDPLLSSMSPEGSNNISSHHSSRSSMEEKEQGCWHCQMPGALLTLSISRIPVRESDSVFFCICCPFNAVQILFVNVIVTFQFLDCTQYFMFNVDS